MLPAAAVMGYGTSVTWEIALLPWGWAQVEGEL